MFQSRSIRIEETIPRRQARLRDFIKPRNRSGLLAIFLVIANTVEAAQSSQLPSAPTPACAVTSPDEVVAMAQRKDTADAEREFGCYEAAHRGEAETAYLRARLYFEEHKATAALAAYTDAAKLKTPSAADLKFVALAYVLLDANEDAEHWLQRSVAMDGSDPDAWYSLGRVEYGLNHFTAAQHAFDRALVLAPRSVKVENNLGLTLEGLGHEQEAEAAYVTAAGWQAGQTKRSEQPLLNLGRLRVHLGRISEALPLLREAETIAPQDPQIHEQLGIAYMGLADFHAAEKEYRTALLATPDNAALHFQLGRVLQKLSDPKQANEEFERAKKLLGTTSSEHHSS